MTSTGEVWLTADELRTGGFYWYRPRPMDTPDIVMFDAPFVHFAGTDASAQVGIDALPGQFWGPLRPPVVEK